MYRRVLQVMLVAITMGTSRVVLSLDLPPTPDGDSTTAAATSVTAGAAVPLVAASAAAAEGGGGTDDSAASTAAAFSDVPEFVSTNNTQTVKEGDSTVLSCQVNKIGSWQIIWHRRQTPQADWKVLRVGATPVLIKAENPRYKFESQSTVLRIDDVNQEDEGLYKCEIAVQNSPKIYVELQVEPADEENADRTWPNGGATSHYPSFAVILVPLLMMTMYI